MALLDSVIKLKKLGVICNQHIMVVDRRAVANMAYLDCCRKHLPTIFTDEAQFSTIKNMLSPIFENVEAWSSLESGTISVPPNFSKPVIFTNAVTLGISPDFPGYIMIPKLLWSRRSNRLLTFKEILSGPYGLTVLPKFDDGQK